MLQRSLGLPCLGTLHQNCSIDCTSTRVNEGVLGDHATHLTLTKQATTTTSLQPDLTVSLIELWQSLPDVSDTHPVCSPTETSSALPISMQYTFNLDHCLIAVPYLNLCTAIASINPQICSAQLDAWGLHPL